MVAYGDGINPHGMNIFDHLAFRGSCDANTLDEANNRTDCEPTIEAKTDSKTKLASKPRQILAGLSQHHQLLQLFKKGVLYIKLNLLMNNMENGKGQF